MLEALAEKQAELAGVAERLAGLQSKLDAAKQRKADLEVGGGDVISGCSLLSISYISTRLFARIPS